MSPSRADEAIQETKRPTSPPSLPNASSSKARQDPSGIRPGRDDGGPLTPQSSAARSSVNLADAMEKSHPNNPHARMAKQGSSQVADANAPLEADDIVIAVIGPAGSGKSTFVCAASGRDTKAVSHTLRSHSNRVTPVRFRDQESGRHIVLVDTPGFDSMSKSDLDILNMISEWLISSYKKKLLSGIVYLHRITDNRVIGSSLKNLRLFRKLCGGDALDRVYLTTTMWDEVELSVGERRLGELKTEFWTTMIAHGAQVTSYESGDDSPKKIIRQIILDESTKKTDASYARIASPQLPPRESRQGSSSHSHSQETQERHDVTESKSRVGKEHASTVLRGSVQAATVQPKIVFANDLNPDDIVIVVIGPTGSGKSTFICAASGHDTDAIGHGLKSFTNEVTAVKFWDQESGRYVVLVDTPGFDGTSRSDFDILNMISDWLVSSHKKMVLVSGILYLHPITSNRMVGVTLKNIRVFRKLCGKEALGMVYFTTTMWEEVESSVGERRLEELKTEYWATMIAHGAQIARCRSDDDSPKELVRHIISSTGGRITPSRLPTEPDQESASQLSRVEERADQVSVRPPRRRGTEIVNANDLDACDIVIVVMGQTGSGKSAFICSASGHDHSAIGHGLKSFTSEVTAVKFWDQESRRYVVLVDTPGFNAFDGASKSDFDTLRTISDWLVSSYTKNIPLSGILYLHPITSVRMMGEARRNLRVFRKLCGPDALDNVYLTTTMWDEVDPSVGERRVEELSQKYWSSMIAEGAHMARCRRDDGSSMQLIRQIISRKAPPKVLLIQREMVDLKKKLKKTAAGRQLARRRKRIWIPGSWRSK